MEKLSMCRICLSGSVHMYIVVNENLRKLYEKLTDKTFVTEDRRPMLACYFCCTKLKQCYQFQRKCLEAEELFAQMLNENYEPNPLLNQNHPMLCYGFSQSPVQNLNIVGECQTESVAIKEELQVDSEGLDYIIELKEKHQNDWLELENQDKSFVNVYVPAQDSESDSDDNMPFMEYELVVEEHEASRNKRSAGDTQRGSAKKSKLKDVTEELRNTAQSESRATRTTEKYEETEGQPSKNRRGESKNWVFAKKFSCVSEAEESVNSEKTWAVRTTHNTSEGKKRFYRCNKVPNKGIQCAAERYLLFEANSDAVLLYRTDCEHNHDSIQQNYNYGISNETKAEISKLYDLYLKPKSILAWLKKNSGSKIPTKRQLYNYLADLRRSKYGPATNKKAGEMDS